MTSTVLYQRDGLIGYITMNRPEILNAMNQQWITDMAAAARAAQQDREARVIVVRGAGRAFCAGADLKEMAQEQERQPIPDYWSRRLGPEEEISRAFRYMGKPVIAQVHGYALGGGLELALLADMRIAAEGTRFGFPEVSVGATVTMSGLYNLVRNVGLGKAFELLYTAEMIDAQEALRIGLVNRVVPLDELEGTVRSLAERIAQHYPFELFLTRSALLQALDIGFEGALELETSAAVLSYAAGTRHQGMAQALDRIHQEKGREGR